MPFLDVAAVLLTLAAVVRVFGPSVAPASTQATWTIAAALWIAAFAIYCVVYAPILARPRVDGKPG